MNYSIFWARLLGLYTVFLVMWTYFNIHQLPVMMGLMQNPSTLIVLAMFTVFLGLAVVVSHSIWRGWPIIISILGYWITFKGLVILFFPKWVSPIMGYWQGEYVYFAPLPALVVAVVLLYFGFCRRKSTM